MKKSILLLLTLILCGFLPLSGKNTGTQQEINLKMPPAVFAVENAYQILVTVKSQSLVWIKVGKKFYSDHINGVRPSGRSVHRFIVPMAELEKEGKYERARFYALKVSQLKRKVLANEIFKGDIKISNFKII